MVQQNAALPITFVIPITSGRARRHQWLAFPDAQALITKEAIGEPIPGQFMEEFPGAE